MSTQGAYANSSSMGEWLRLPSGLYVSTSRLQEVEGVGILYHSRDIGGFGKEHYINLAREQNVHFEPSDTYIDMLVKASVFVSRRNGVRSFMPTRRQYTDMELAVAAAKETNSEPLAGFHRTLTQPGSFDVVRDVLKIVGIIRSGSGVVKYKAELLRFDDDARRMPVDCIEFAEPGWIRMLDPKHGYPVETSQKPCFIENLGEFIGDDRGRVLSEKVKGNWRMDRKWLKHPDSVVGKEVIPVHMPDWWSDDGLLAAQLEDHRKPFIADMLLDTLMFRSPPDEDCGYRMEEAA